MAAASPLTCRVLNLSRGVAGAYATRMLADLGARCQTLRWRPPRPGEWPASDGFRAYFERGVPQIDLPCSQEELLDRLGALAAAYDLIIADFTAPEAGPEGTLYERLRPFNPRLVVGNVDHFGRSGPYAGWAGDELTDYALGGYWALAGDPAREPLRVPGFQAQFHAGMQLVVAVLAALRYARLSDRGQEVNVNAVEAMLGAHWSTTVAWTHEGRVLKRTGPDLFEASDGWVFFYGLGFYPNLFFLIDQPELMDDPRWATAQSALAHAADLAALISTWCRDRPAEEIAERAQELRMPVTAMATAASLLADRHLNERGYFVEHSGIRYPGLPYRWEEPWRVEPAPDTLPDNAGTNTRVLAPPLPITARELPAGTGPLTGLRVIEVTNNWAGPIAGRHLADLGAEVIKVELASKPATRLSHYPGKEPGKYHWNRSGYFNEMNRNKRDVALNLASSRGRELFLRLVAWADVLVENNSARVMPNLGLDYETLRKANPRLVMASISGFGASGPKRDWVAFGSNIEAACGLAAITGYEGNVPYRTGSFVADPIAGAHAVIGILAALERRDRTGQGAHLDIALTESAIPFMTESITYYQEHGALMPRTANADPAFAPTSTYRCAG
ncbi:MAG TPA: CoA transferase, partial [Dehalococcoidia bacterium]|nr:CoA transferase [Dehalococcoidia bacterium]